MLYDIQTRRSAHAPLQSFPDSLGGIDSAVAKARPRRRSSSVLPHATRRAPAVLAYFQGYLRPDSNRASCEGYPIVSTQRCHIQPTDLGIFTLAGGGIGAGPDLTRHSIT